MNIKRQILILLAAVLALPALAQTATQNGKVRMITNSSSAPVQPVAGASVVIGNIKSNPTDPNGSFSLKVPSTFQVNGIYPDEYILAIPTKGKTHHRSPNDLEVVVTTKAKKEKDYRRLYNEIKAKYDAQTDEIMMLKREYQRKLNDIDEADAAYAATQAKIDSLQEKLLEYMNNESRIDEEIRRISDELALTDYQTLDSIGRKIYDLKCQGQWKSITDMLQDLWKGDAASFLKEGKANEERKQQELLQAQMELQERYALIEDAIEACRML